MIQLALTTFLLLAGSIAAVANDASDLPPIRRFKDMKPESSIFKAATRQKPLTIKSVMDAEKHFSEGELAKLEKQVDFDKQIVLVFAWRGSGQDKLTYDVLESFPEQIVFKYTPGRTKDQVAFMDNAAFIATQPLPATLFQRAIVKSPVRVHDVVVIETSRLASQVPLPDDRRFVTGFLQQLGKRLLRAVERVHIEVEAAEMAELAGQKGGAGR